MIMRLIYGEEGGNMKRHIVFVVLAVLFVLAGCKGNKSASIPETPAGRFESYDLRFQIAAPPTARGMLKDLFRGSGVAHANAPEETAIRLPDVIAGNVTVTSDITNTGTVEARNLVLVIETYIGTMYISPTETRYLCFRCYNYSDGSGVAGCEAIIEFWDNGWNGTCNADTPMGTTNQIAGHGFCDDGAQEGIDCDAPVYNLFVYPAPEAGYHLQFSYLPFLAVGDTITNGINISTDTTPYADANARFKVIRGDGTLLSRKDYVWNYIVP